MPLSNPTFDYRPDRVYTLSEFERYNDWLKTHDFVIDGTPVNHFERDTKGRLTPMPQTTLDKEPVVSEIARQVGDWNIHTQQNGVVTTSQGGFRFGAAIRAPDVAFVPKEVYRDLTPQQLSTFQGPPFCPTFAVEVENFQTGNNEANLIAKFKQTYFPAGLRLGWMVDPINRQVFCFRRDADGVVHRREHPWFDNDGEPTVVSGREVLPGFELKLWKIDEITSQDSSESESDESDEEFSCPKLSIKIINLCSIMKMTICGGSASKLREILFELSRGASK